MKKLVLAGLVLLASVMVLVGCKQEVAAIQWVPAVAPRAVSRGLNRDSLKSLNVSRFSQPNGRSLPTSERSEV